VLPETLDTYILLSEAPRPNIGNCTTFPLHPQHYIGFDVGSREDNIFATNFRQDTETPGSHFSGLDFLHELKLGILEHLRGSQRVDCTSSSVSTRVSTSVTLVNPSLAVIVARRAFRVSSGSLALILARARETTREKSRGVASTPGPFLADWVSSMTSESAVRTSLRQWGGVGGGLLVFCGVLVLYPQPRMGRAANS
jgi:hypothetical protein